MSQLEALELTDARNARLIFVLGNRLAYKAALPRCQVHLDLVYHRTIILQILVEYIATLVDIVI